ncbi:MAG: tRNA (adenosine(37)-N6)-threonylcarbamoyltransferase complex ATPase subunit type 1 TsaE [Acidobacteria bacterium]|nr:MAG: tRNA (adenosine(37)-N6)-threonylcarbamoyltransferase complex ATPase subunit type 1 TsaE [Acidobacteriota bacterium]
MHGVFSTNSEEDTARLAARFASALAPGAIVLLTGDLGAGKTVFVRGMAAGIGVDPDEVSSPTFTLIQEYRGRSTLFHVDLYRIEGGEVDDLGLEELTTAGGIAAIEWAEKLPRPLPGAISVTILDQGDDRRKIEIEKGPRVRPTPTGSSALPW